MDKISSYPLGLLEADARAESHWARASTHRIRPCEWRQFRKPWAQVIGPICTLTGQAQVSGAIPYVGQPYGPSFAGLKQFQNCTDFRNKTAPFSQNEIARFFQHPVISKITYLIN